MKIISNKEFEALANVKGEKCVSIYIPTHRSGEAVTNGKDVKNLKNHVQKVKNKLEEDGMTETAAQKYLEPIYNLIEDGSFWRHQLDGLAVFLSADHFSYHRLPMPVESYCFISNSFQLRQLIPFLNEDGIYFILAASLEDIKLYEATHFYIHELDIEGRVQKGMEEVLKYYDFEQALQNHSAGTSGGNNQIYHGQGAQKSDKKHLIEEYFRNVCEGLRKIVATDKSPIVLAGVDYLHPIFRQAANGLNIMEKGLKGNPEQMSLKDLHQRSWKCVKGYFDSEKERSKRAYNDLAGTGKTTYDMERIVPAAINGRIESLFVAKGTSEVWGKFHEATQAVDVHEGYNKGDDELISHSAVQTILNGGNAYIVDPGEMPDQTVERNVMAVLRF